MRNCSVSHCLKLEALRHTSQKENFVAILGALDRPKDSVVGKSEVWANRCSASKDDLGAKHACSRRVFRIMRIPQRLSRPHRRSDICHQDGDGVYNAC
jgi:hypothetical protein